MVTLNELSSEFSNTAMLSTDDDLEDGEIFDDEEESDYNSRLEKETKIIDQTIRRISNPFKILILQKSEYVNGGIYNF